MTKSCLKSSYIYVFILSKQRRNWFRKNLHNSGIVNCRILPDPSLNRIFNALSIGVQYTLSFQWTNFGLKYLLIAVSMRFPWWNIWGGINQQSLNLKETTNNSSSFLTHLFLKRSTSTTWKHQKTWFSDFFRGERKGALGTNGLMEANRSKIL